MSRVVIDDRGLPVDAFAGQQPAGCEIILDRVCCCLTRGPGGVPCQHYNGNGIKHVCGLLPGCNKLMQLLIKPNVICPHPDGDKW